MATETISHDRAASWASQKAILDASDGDRKEEW